MFKITYLIATICFFITIAPKAFSQCDTPAIKFSATAIRDIHLFDTSRMIAIGINGNIIHSNNGGISWFKNVSINENFQFNKIAFPSDQIGYATTFFGNVVCKTEDGGNTWFPIQLPGNSSLGQLYFLNINKGFVITSDGHLYTTLNGAHDWTDQYSYSYSYRDITFTPSGTGFICGTNKLLLRSTDGGINWTEITVSALPFGANFNRIKFYDNQVGFIATDFGYILKTTNGGLTWTSLPTLSNAYFYDIFIYDLNNILFVGEYGGVGYIQKTVDGGQNWLNPYYTYPGRNASFFTAKSDPAKQKIIVAGSGGGGQNQGRTIISTKDMGLTWTSYSANPKLDFTTMQFLNDSTGYITGEEGLVYKTKDYGESWKLLNTGFASTNRALYFIDEQNGYLMNDSLYKTTNGGVTWTKLNSNIQYGGGNNLFYFFDQSTGVYSVGDRIYKTVDGGINWLLVLDPGSFWPKYGMFFSGNKGYVVGYFGMAKQSTDAGSTWTPMNLNTNRFLTSVYFYDSNRGFIGTSDSIIFRTTNGGATWDSVNTHNNGLAFRMFQFFNDTTGYVIGNNLGGTTIIYKTKDGGLTWRSEIQISEDVTASAGASTIYFAGKRGLLLRTEKLRAPGIPGYIIGRDSTCVNRIEPYMTYPVSGSSLTWTLSSGGINKSFANRDTVAWNAAGTHTLSVQASNVCGAGPIRNYLIKVIQYVPTITQISDTVLMASTGISYQWYRNDTLIFGGTTQSLIVRSSASYKVKVTNMIGCTEFSNAFPFIATGIEDPALRNGIRVFPNPANHFIYVKLGQSLFGQFTFKIYNQAGQEIWYSQKTKTLSEQIVDIPLKNLPRGSYFIRIYNKDRFTVWKFVKY